MQGAEAEAALALMVDIFPEPVAPGVAAKAAKSWEALVQPAHPTQAAAVVAVVVVAILLVPVEVDSYSFAMQTHMRPHQLLQE
jgi:hypothetical protein